MKPVIVAGDEHLLKQGPATHVQPPLGEIRRVPEAGTALPQRQSRFPKEWGARSDYALGKLRSLHDLELLPMAKSILPDATAYKRNGFDEIVRKPEDPKPPGRYFTEGRTAIASSHLHVAGSTRAPFRERPVSVVNGLAGSAFLGKNRSAALVSIAGSTITLGRTRDFRTSTSEGTLGVYPASAGVTYYVSYLGPFYYRQRDAFDPAAFTRIEYEVVQRSVYDASNNVLPALAYSSGTSWLAASGVVGFDTYDHFTYSRSLFPLLPNVVVSVSAPIARGLAYPLGARSTTPNGITPYPLFQISLDAGRTYDPIDMDFLFDGCTKEYERPRTGGTSDVAGAGAYRQVTSITMMSLPQNTFISFKAVIDTASAISYTGTSLEGIFEPRIFRTNGGALTSAVSIPPPSGHGTIYLAPLNCVFANSHPANGPANFGTIGFQARAVNLDNPSVLFVSTDNGTTWSAPRYLPGTSRYSGTVFQVDEREIGIMVYEAFGAGFRTVRYGSLDFGLTWSVRQIVSENPYPLGPLDVLSDLATFGRITPEDGGLPTSYPMGAWVMDSRAPLYLSHPAT